jgi:predicted SprT family Zn-dependent metalloprotease
MKAEKAERMAVQLMKRHGLTDKGWAFRFNFRIGSVGRATNDNGKKFIELSLPIVEVNQEEIINDVLLHEIGHAKRGIGHKHDSKWRSITKSIGGSGIEFWDVSSSCAAKSIVMPKGIGQWVCDNCSWSSEIYRRPKPRVRYSCRNCHSIMRRHYYPKPHTTYK